MKKKVLALIMTVLLVVCMGGCKGKADKSADDVVATSGDAATMTDAAGVTDESEKAQSDEEKTDDKSDKDNTEEASGKPSGTDKPETEMANSGSSKPDSSKPDTSNNGAPSTTQAQQTSQPQAGAEEQTTAHQHTWKTVVDKEAYDEPVYEEQDVYENHSMWPDGTYADELLDPCAKARWCGQHCTSCFPNCPEPDPAGRCAFSITYGPVWVGTEKVQVGTEHHDAVTHQECTVCGARK